MEILSVQNIHKSYGAIKALKGVSFAVPEGAVFGILGPNGSGKTTLLGIVMNVLIANGGNYLWFGQEAADEQRKKIGTLLETPNFYHYLSGKQNLAITAAIQGHSPAGIDAVLQKVNLYERRDSRFSTYSLGMKQRLALAAALLGDPSVLVLDEPTNGLDPVGIAETRELIKLLASEGKTIILASHLLDEVEKVCTHVAILQRGDLITYGHVDEVLKNEDIVEISASDNDTLERIIKEYSAQYTLKRDGNYVQLFFQPGTANLDQINRFCFERGIVLNHLRLKKKSLESKFFELTHGSSVN
ncbi:MAG: ABC transporter ATP-binding protein [Williamsia sp.]|nr:ABC transporter ATP-binding protein [Williamsia sp.]